MKNIVRRMVYLAIGWTEIAIGFVTVLGIAAVQVWGIGGLPRKPDEVYVFVTATGIAAFVLGAGLVRGKNWARILLIFFSGYIILTKILIYFGLLTFNGAMLTIIPAGLKDVFSSLYHLILILLLSLFPINSERERSV